MVQVVVVDVDPTNPKTNISQGSNAFQVTIQSITEYDSSDNVIILLLYILFFINDK